MKYKLSLFIFAMIISMLHACAPTGSRDESTPLPATQSPSEGPQSLSPAITPTNEQWPISIRVNGVFRISDQINQNQQMWWREKLDSCYETLKVGDMVYFSAVGYPLGEHVRFIIDGPNKQETYDVIIQGDLAFVGGGICEGYLF